MKINGYQNIPSVLQTLKTGKPTSGETLGSAEKSPVTFSTFAETLQNLQRASAQAAQDRQPRVNELAKQEAAGSIKVDLSKVAARLVELNVVDFGQ